MHELAEVKSVHEIVLKHARAAGASRVLSVNLEIGALSDLQDVWVHRYFGHLSRGAITEGATVEISKVPGVFRCAGCGSSFEVRSLPGDDLGCPRCGGGEVKVVSGRGIQVKGIDVV